MGRAHYYEETTSAEEKPLKNVHTWPLNVVTNYLVCNMAAGVHQGRMLREPLQSMADQIDVEMEKEEHGRTTSTECLVWFKMLSFVLFFCSLIQKRVTGQEADCMPQLSLWPEF